MVSAGSDKKEDDWDGEVDFEVDLEDPDAGKETEGAAENADAEEAESNKRGEAPVPNVEPQLCVFPLPIDDGQLQSLIEKLDALLGQIEVDPKQIDADWVRFVEKIDFKTEMTSFEDTLRFLRQLKIQSQAIAASGAYGIFKQVPTADRAISKISTAASDCIKALDASKPEVAITVLYNLKDLCHACPRVIDDDVELQEALKADIDSRCKEASAWVTRLQNDLADKGEEYYGKSAQGAFSSRRRRLLHSVVHSFFFSPSPLAVATSPFSAVIKQQQSREAARPFRTQKASPRGGKESRTPQSTFGEARGMSA